MNVYDEAHSLAKAIKESNEFKEFDRMRVQIEADEEVGIHMDVLQLVHVVGAYHRIAEIPGMVGKDIGVDVVAQLAQQQDGENGNGTGVALVEGVDVPDAGGEEGYPF